MRKLGFLIGMAALLGACGLLPGGTTYPVPAKDARATLLLTEPPLYLFGNEVAKARVSRDGEGTVRWLLVDRLGTGIVTLVARSEEAGANKTRVSVSVEPPPGGRHDVVAKRLEENPAIANFFKAAMAEQIDATFEKREFDMMAIQGEMVLAAMAVAPQMQKDFDEAAHRPEPQHTPYRDDPESDEPAYGEPMDSAAGSDY